MAFTDSRGIQFTLPIIVAGRVVNYIGISAAKEAVVEVRRLDDTCLLRFVIPSSGHFVWKAIDLNGMTQDIKLVSNSPDTQAFLSWWSG